MAHRENIRWFTNYPIEDYRARHEEIDKAVRGVLEGGNYILGEQVRRFEEQFGSFVGNSAAVGVANGTDAIELLLRALGIGPGDLVAVPSQTAVATVCGVARAGAEPVFVDVDPLTFTMLPESLNEAIRSSDQKKLKAVLVVHLYGHPASMDLLKKLCSEHGLILLEDCAQAVGATYHGSPVGTIGCGAAFSFYPTKNLGAIGDGGCVITSDNALAEKIRCLRQYGWRRRYFSDFEGINSRLDELQAAILSAKLPLLAEGNRRRRSLAEIYHKGLSNLPVQAPRQQPDCEHVYHLYVVRTKRRDALMGYLKAKDIPVSRHYPAAVHQQPAYARFTAHSPALPHTEKLVQEILTLPLHPFLSEEAVQFTVQAICDFFA